MIHGSGNVRLTELTADASAIKPGGVDQVIIQNASLVAGPNVGLPAEGSQMQKDQRQVLPLHDHLAAGRHAYPTGVPVRQPDRPL